MSWAFPRSQRWRVPVAAGSACHRRNCAGSRPWCRAATSCEAKPIGKDNVNGWPFDLYVTHGAGVYICGEEVVRAYYADAWGPENSYADDLTTRRATALFARAAP